MVSQDALTAARLPSGHTEDSKSPTNHNEDCRDAAPEISRCSEDGDEEERRDAAPTNVVYPEFAVGDGDSTAFPELLPLTPSLAQESCDSSPALSCALEPALVAGSPEAAPMRPPSPENGEQAEGVQGEVGCDAAPAESVGLVPVIEEALLAEAGLNAHEYLEDCFRDEASVLDWEKFDAVPEFTTLDLTLTVSEYAGAACEDDEVTPDVRA